MYLSNLLLIVSNWTHSRLNRELWFTMALNNTFGLYNIYMCWTRIPPLIIYVQWYILCVRIYKRYFLKNLKIDEMATSMQPWERERFIKLWTHLSQHWKVHPNLCFLRILMTNSFMENEHHLSLNYGPKPIEVDVAQIKVMIQHAKGWTFHVMTIETLGGRGLHMCLASYDKLCHCGKTISDTFYK